jgi:hypothetical protein
MEEMLPIAPEIGPSPVQFDSLCSFSLRRRQHCILEDDARDQKCRLPRWSPQCRRGIYNDIWPRERLHESCCESLRTLHPLLRAHGQKLLRIVLQKVRRDKVLGR